MSRGRVVSALLLTLLVACSQPTAGRGAAPTPSEEPAAVSGSFTRPVGLAGEPCGMEVTEVDVWILACSGSLVRVPRSGSAPSVEHLGGEVLSLDGLVSGSNLRLWALVSAQKARARNGSVVPIVSGRVGQGVAVGASVPMSAAQVGTRLWVAMLDGRLLALRDGIVHEADQGPPLTWTAAEASVLWTIGEAGDVTLRDPDTGVARATTPGVALDAIAAAAAYGSLWFATPTNVSMLDAAGGDGRKLAVSGTVNGIEPCAGAVWFSDPDFGVRSVSPEGEPGPSVELPVAPRYLACGGETLWVLAEDGRLGSVSIPR